MNKMNPMIATSRRTRQQGLTLIELMIGLTIGLVLVAGLATLFANSSKTTDEMQKTARLFENGRYAVDLLNEDLNHGGFYADVLATAGTPSYALPGACAVNVPDLGWAPAVGATAATVPVPVMGLTSAQAATLPCLLNHKANTPAIVIHRLDTTAVSPVAAVSAPYLQTSRCSTAPETFMIATGTGTNATFPLQNVGCLTVATVRKYISRVYYIASCNECTGAGIDTIPTLKRAELNGTQISVTPLVEGIEDMAFEYGFDTNFGGNTTKFDGAPDVYLSGLSGTALANDNKWENVVSVRTYILSRDTEITAGFTENKTYSMGLAGTRGPFTDKYKRRSYSITSNLTNVSGARDGT